VPACVLNSGNLVQQFLQHGEGKIFFNNSENNEAIALRFSDNY